MPSLFSSYEWILVLLVDNFLEFRIQFFQRILHAGLVHGQSSLHELHVILLALSNGSAGRAAEHRVAQRDTVGQDLGDRLLAVILLKLVHLVHEALASRETILGTRCV